MSEESPYELSEEESVRPTRHLNLKLAGAAVGLVLALLIAPGSRRLFLAQAGITVPMSRSIASIAGSQLGIRPDPFEGRFAVQAAARVAERLPNDVQVQLASATALMPEDERGSSQLKVRRLRALESRFRDSPALYANILRYESQGEIRVHHTEEQCVLSGDPIPVQSNHGTNNTKALDISPAAYLAYDQDAAAGERLDPDNAYFPFMRAAGLFGANRDEEAVAAIARAARKPQWREYYNDELKGQWKLQDEGFVNNSALLHSVAAMAVLFPQYAQMRAAARLTIYRAMKAEQAGQYEEGLALRTNILRLGSLMRVQSANLIGSIVGNAMADNAIARPGGLEAIKVNERNEKEQQGKLRRQFDAYLQRVKAVQAMDAFHTAQQEGDAMKEIVRQGGVQGPFDRPFANLSLWWMADLLTLSNILWLLVLGGLARLFLRLPHARTGTCLPGVARLALPLGLISGGLAAPGLLNGLSPYFGHSGLADGSVLWLVIGFVPVLFMLPASTLRERMQRVGVFASSWLLGLVLTGCFFWQARGVAGIADLMRVYSNLSTEGGVSLPDLSSVLLWLTPCVSLLILLVSAILSPICRVPLSVGIARGFRGLMVPVAALLFLIYGGMLLCTMRAEAAVRYGLERTLENEGQYIADLYGKQWPPSEIAKKLVSPE